MRGRNYAREHSELSRKVAPLGRFIVEKLHQKMPGPPRVPRVSALVPVCKKSGDRTKGSECSRGRANISANGREAPVLRACLKWLHAHGIFAWRNNSGTLWAAGAPVSFGYPGSADILGITPAGTFLAVECKSATGRQSDKQIKFQQKIEANGGLYILARSVEELGCLIPR